MLLAAPLAAGCFVLRFGNPDSTLVREMPPQVPPSEWHDGPPRVPVIFEGVFRAAGDGPLVRDENASHTYARRLRKAKVFSEVGGPDVTAAPENAGRARVEIRYSEDLNDATNLVRAVAPGLTAYEIDLTGTATLHLELPDAEEPRVYGARTALTRQYYSSGRRDVSRRILYREVDDTNFLALVHQLRADPLLFGPPAGAAGEALPAEP